jgi:Zn finger protein HypA/HybF involved in hydrogenase expression
MIEKNMIDANDIKNIVEDLGWKYNTITIQAYMDFCEKIDQLIAEEEEKPMETYAYWYCHECKGELSPENVTFEEKCDTCGHPVDWIESSPAEEKRCPDDYNSVLAKIESYLKPQKQMLDALIGYCINYESNDHNSKLMGGAWYNHFLEIIESVTGNPWGKIKKELE